MSSDTLIKIEKKGSLFLIALDRPGERNAMNTEMILQLSNALTEYENDSKSLCAVIYANGLHFTFGLELQEVAKTMMERGENLYPQGNINPWDTGGTGRHRTKPIICAVHGFCLTLGIELLLACDIALAAEKTVFAQMEVQRGIPPFGGATIRFVRTAGWGNAMKYILTGDSFDAKEAYRMGLVQEVLPKKDLLPRAIELAEKIAAQAPNAVKASISMARKALIEGQEEAVKDLFPITLTNLKSEDGQEGIKSFLEKRSAVFKGQ